MKKHGLSLDAWVAIAIIAIIAVLSIEGFVRQDIPELAARFPMAVFAVVVVTGLAEAIRSIVATRRENREAAAHPETAKADKPVFKNHRNFLAISALIIVYSVCMPYLGFVVATILFFIAFVLYFKFTHIILFSVCSIVGVIVVYYCFTRLMHIRLPVGDILPLFS